MMHSNKLNACRLCARDFRLCLFFVFLLPLHILVHQLAMSEYIYMYIELKQHEFEVLFLKNL